MPALALIIAQALIQYGPEVASGIANILHVQGDPALAQWNAIFSSVRTYAQLFPPTTSASPGTSTLVPPVNT